MRRGGAAAAIAIAVLAAVLALPGGAGAEHSRLELISTGPGPEGRSGPAFFRPLLSSPDGRRVLFNSFDALVHDVTCEGVDPDTGEVFTFTPENGYERFNGVTSLVTTGPLRAECSHIAIRAASKDATRAFFHAVDLVAEDTNRTQDVYERAGGVTKLLSAGPSGPGTASSTLIHVSEDGRHVFFATTNRLVPEDSDDCIDYYEHVDGTTRLASVGIPPITTPHGTQCATLTRLGISADGERLFLVTNANVTSDDTDVPDWQAASVGADIYEFSDGEARLISTGPAETSESGSVGHVSAISRDGRRVVFVTAERLVAEDTDTFADSYVRFDGETSLLAPPIPGDTSPPVSLLAMSADGSRMIVSAGVRLVPEDIDNQLDIYAIEDGSVELLSVGPAGGNGSFGAHWVTQFPGLPAPGVTDVGTGGASEDARVVVFSTAEQLVPTDTDSTGDLYANVDGVTHLVSTGTNDGPGRSFNADTFRGLFVSPDGSRVFFVTDDPLAVEDTDALDDVYEWHAGRTTVVPDGIPTPERVWLADPQWPRSFVHDGSRVFIHTPAALTVDDPDTNFDLYGVAVNAAPDCGSVTASPSLLWPANRKLARVALAGATDADGDDVSIEITDVTQDEPIGGSRDAVLNGAGGEVRLRAERDNRGDGRVYRIGFEATDGHGGSCTGTAKVSVPRHKNRAAVDSAPPSYDSFG